MVAERRPKKRRDYLASWSVMSVRLQDQASCLRERSRREDPATTRAVHELDLRDQDVENVYWAWRTTLSYDASFVLTCSLDRENPGNYDHFHFLPWCFGGSSKVHESLGGGARLVLHPSETLGAYDSLEVTYANTGFDKYTALAYKNPIMLVAFIRKFGGYFP
ncbi:hypothetical protein K0M31_004627 [Melipona bicolor]|uniref:Uncharacterized protein n=1 Tax=Melipona bicolor TaxID=60889 RepID=A0AA40FX67_9HYME|nr:hypothetical protein K0M31_004627 [Melipona bicolor]